MLKIYTILGARPQFVKAAPLTRALKKSYATKVEEFYIHTGQHYDNNMSDIFFNELCLPEPIYNLGVGGMETLPMIAQMIDKLTAVLNQDKPDGVVAYGDTNSTLAASVTCAHLQIPLFHVEAGLRSNNLSMPEEINRIVTDRLASINFAPTLRSYNQLIKEGCDDARVMYSGDVMMDSVEHLKEIIMEYQKGNQIEKKYVFVTVHRPYNTDNKERLVNIISFLKFLEERKGYSIYWPLHPRTAKQLKIFNLSMPNTFQIVEPIGYLESIKCQSNAEYIITDSGGIQKESYFLKKKSLVLRGETEWSEVVESGWSRLATTDSVEALTDEFQNLVNGETQGIEDFGGGTAASSIADKIVQYYQ